MSGSALPWPIRPTVSARRDVPALEGIRGLAVTMVFVVHYGAAMGARLEDSPAQRALLDALMQAGHAGVDLFFVLSGYLIHRLLIGRPRPFGDYLRRRLRRIYPTFLVVLTLYVVLSLVAPGVSKLPDDPAAAVTLTLANAALLPGVFDIVPIVTVSWSLSYELAFYLALPAAIAVLRLGRWTSARRVTLFATLAIGVFLALSVSGADHVRAILFLAGMIVHELAGEPPADPDGEPDARSAARHRHRRASIARPAIARHVEGWGLPMLVLALVAIATIEALSVSAHLRYAVVFVPFGLFCLDAIVNDGRARAPFERRAPRWLGTISYSYYLIHGLVTSVAGAAIAVLVPPGRHDALLFWTAMPLVFAASLGAGAVLFALVEQPLSLAPTRGRRDARTSPARAE